ncbi:MAG: hypothetical protein E7624_08670 [Ruminococcaceae bacterium]|nr:hypothetical protein [Oscillospiraceae bacterium]
MASYSIYHGKGNAPKEYKLIAATPSIIQRNAAIKNLHKRGENVLVLTYENNTVYASHYLAPKQRKEGTI